MAERVTVQVDAIGNFSNIIGEVGKFRSQLQSLKLPDKLTAKLEKGFDNVESKVAHFQSLLGKGITTKNDFSKLVSSARSAETAIDGLKNDIKSIGDKDIQIAVANSADIQKAEEALKKVLNMEKQLSSFGTSKGTGSFGEKEVANMQKLANTSEGLRKRFKDVTDAIKTGNIDQASAALEKLIAHAQKYQAIADKNNKDTSKWDSTIKWAQGAQTQIDGLVTKANQARNSFEQIKIDKFTQMRGSVDGVANGFANAANAAKQFMSAETEAASRTTQLNEQVGHLRTQANYFFGLQNMGRLVARGIREAAESVRDLDKAMTDTAVVTEFSVGDMWNMLPEYTKLANKLGATTQGAYETMTLYFQQGLNKQETFEIGEETMKMARIAGLDYAQTTNMMTAALRGFNMELNQTSAKRVNDVYSELAAITASDTRELGLAMERTASIAHSANMDFGNTTAFLAQMIETTREAPENLGTAMKTIIARFQELKENPYEVSEVEGEEVDFNRVDKALKSIGVDLMDNRDKFRDLDDVFMDISSKWDGLSQTQQRYIATIAAGSRQQSRFLAMVQNYDRLKELTDAAANSEDAATVQFNKTLDSYEAKVNRLKNAWQAFTMSLANNKAVKGGVDILQKIITFGNKIIETFGKAGKAIGGDFGKGLAEMVAAFGLGAAGFKGLQFGANAGLGMLAKMTTGSKAGGRFFMGGGTGRAESGMVTAKITNPIVNAVNRVTAAIQKKPFKDANYQNTKARSDLLRDRRDALYNKMRTKDETNTGMRIGNQYGDQQYFSPYKAFNASDVKKQMAGLTAAEQEAIYKSSPILQKALQRGYSKAYSKLNLGPDGEKALNKHWKEMSQKISSGQISTQEALRQLYNPDKVAQDIGGETGKKITEAINNRIKTWKPADKEALEKKLMTQAEKRFGVGDETRQERRQWVNQQVKFKASQELGIGRENTAQITKAEGAITKLSSSASSAGQSVMGLGMALSSAGFAGAGAILMTVGNGIMGIGMAAEGATTAIGALGKAFKALGVTSLATAITNPVLLGITALGGLVAAGVAFSKKHEDNLKKIQKDSKKVLKNYEKDITDTTRNINKLTDSKDTYAQLSQGVDENNNNISLGTAEYADYLQIVNEVAKMHPELVKGYNAHGQAILKSNNAVEKAIKLEQERQQKAEEAFASEKSLNKLIAGRNTTKRWQVGQDGPKTTNGYIDTTKQSKLKTDSQAVIDSIKELKGGQKLLNNMAQQFGIDASDFNNLTDAGMKAIQEHGANMLDQVQSQLGDASDKTTRDLVKNVQDNIAQVGKDTEGIEEVTEPIYKSLSTFASQEGIFDNIPDEFRDAAERGLKEISKLSVDEFGNQITGEAMQRMARDLGNNLADLGGHATEYQKILDDVGKAQDDYVKNLNKEDYLKDDRIQAAVSNLQQWADEARAKGDETSLILAETFENQLASIKNFTSEGAAILSEGFNTFGDIISAANGAFEDFQKQIEGGDFYTGSNSFKQIFDEIQDGIDNAGKGSQTWWKGAEKLLGEGNKNILEGNFKAAEAQVKALEPMFAEGKAGADAFFDHVATKQTETFDTMEGSVADLFKVADGHFDLKLNELTDEQFADLANQLGMSDQMLAAMLNKAKQFYNIDFSNVDVLRGALATSESTIVGKGKSTSGEQNLYTKESTFKAEAQAQGYTPKEFKDLKNKLVDKGVKLVKDSKDITKDDMKSYIDGMGIKTGQQFIDSFSKLGFSRDELQSLYNQYSGLEGMKGENGESFQQMYSDYIKAQETANLEPDAKAASELETTNSLLSGILAAVGGISLDSGQKELENVVGKKGKNDTAAQRFGEGLNASGNKFANEQEYNASKKALESEITNNQRIIDGLTARKNELHGSEKKAIEDEIIAYQKANQVIAANLKEGEKKYEQLQKEKQAQEEKNKAKEDEKTETAEDSTQADKALETTENLQKVKEAQDALKTNGFNIGQAFGLEDGQISQAALQFSNIINTLKQSGVEVEGLGAALQNLGPGGLEKLNNTDLGKLISSLNLTEEQAAAINALNPELHVTSTADTSEADTAVQNVEEETAQPKILKVITEATGNVKQVAQQAADKSKQEKTTTTTTTTNNITLQSTIANPDEPKTKIDDAIPSTYKKTVKPSITISSTTNTPKQKKETVEKKSGVINYKSNIQSVKVKDLSAKVKYTLGNQAKPKDKTAKVNYTLGTQANPKAKTAKVNYAAKGMNNQIPSYSIPNLGSLAKGTRYGRLGPKGKGGLTLTGEEGYEIAWLPSESRSMILGANGPQMINLPKDAVVYTHEQSEEILKKRDTIEAGSHNKTASGSGTYKSSSNSGSKGKGKKKKSKKKKKKSKKNKNKNKDKGTINNFSIEEVVRFNLEPQLSRLTEQIADRTKEIEKILTGIGKTYDDIVGSANKQVDALNQVKEKNKALYNSYANQLADFRSQKGSVSWTDDKGKSHDKTINIGDWVDANGVINQSKIAALGSRAEREATFNFLNNTVKGLVDGMANADKAMKDAQEQIDELGKKISEAFYQWKNELTEVYDLTQRINNEVSFTNRFTSQVELELSKLSSGFGETAKAIKNIRSVLTRNNATIKEQIENQQQMIAARQRELNAAISYEDEIAQRQKYEASNFGGNTAIKNATVAWARDQETIAMKALSYVTDVFKDIDGSVKYNIDWAKFNAEQDQSPINKETYDKIKTYLDDLNNAATEFNNAIKEQTDFIKQTYESLKEYQENIVDFEDTLIKGVEEEIENETENAKKISSSISDALKDLLDEVKRKLDERRKQEDNAKTERDISQKQQRLAALRADTAGGHQVEIAQLEKEIADAQQDYGRTLEDQLLDRLQQQADKASEQRERQIELAETSNEISAANNKELVDSWLREPEKYKEQIKAAWLEANGYDEKGEAGQYVLRNQFESDFAELVTAVEQTNFADHFNTLTADTNSLVALLQELTNGQLGREDELSHKLDDVNALYDVTDRNTTSILTEIQKGNIADLRAKGVDAKTLKSMGYNASTLIKAGGYTADELQKAGFTAQEVFDAGITDVGTLKNAGYGAGEIKAAGANNVADFKDAGFEAKDLKDIFSPQDLINALFEVKDLKEAGIDAGTLKAANFTATQLKEGGYTAAQLKAGGYNQYDLGAGNYNYNEARQVYTAAELKAVSQYAAAADKEIKDAEAARIKAQKYNTYISQLQAVKRIKPGNVKASHVNSLFNYGAAAGYGKASVLLHLVGSTGGSDPFSWKNIFKAIIDANGIDRFNLVKTWPNGNGSLADGLKTLGNPDTLKEIKKDKRYGKAVALRYATGGLADYTGPAWLDGTPSKPELVLNAADTKNFLALKDVLSRAVHSSNSISNSYGDATYEININVDHLNNDYDVDKVAERVKKIIVKDAGYRNVTQVRNFR